MTESPRQTKGIALLCDTAGTVVRVLYDGLALGGRIGVGRSLLNLVDWASAGKAELMLARIVDQGAAFGWEINLPVGGSVMSFVFGGVATEDHLVIVGAESDGEVSRLYASLAGVVNQQARELRALSKERDIHTGERHLLDSHLFDEITQLNNHLSDIQRELAQKNAELERLYVAETKHSRQSEAVATAVSTLLSTLELEPLLERIRTAALQSVPKANQAVLGLQPDSIAAWLGTVDLEPKPVLLPDLEGPRFSDCRAQVAGPEPVLSAAVVPLVLRGQAIGILALTASLPAVFDQEDLRVLVAIGAAATAAIDNARLHSEVSRLATRDELTGLLNRRALFTLGQGEIDRARRYGQRVSAMMMDIDGFKGLNDTLGHAAGDEALVDLAAVCRRELRAADLVARYGGDELAAILCETDRARAIRVADRIRQKVERSTLAGTRATISIGVATLEDGCHELKDLLARADSALYEAKRAGRNCVRAWDNSPT